MAIGPDGQEAMHIGMASPPHPASSRARPFAPTIEQAFHHVPCPGNADWLWSHHIRTKARSSQT